MQFLFFYNFDFYLALVSHLSAGVWRAQRKEDIRIIGRKVKEMRVSQREGEGRKVEEARRLPHRYYRNCLVEHLRCFNEQREVKQSVCLSFL